MPTEMPTDEDVAELAAGLTWQRTIVPPVTNLLEQGKRPVTYGRFGVNADKVSWLVLDHAPAQGVPIKAIMAVVTEAPNEASWFRCNVCNRKGMRPNPEHARVAVSVHFAANHAMVGRDGGVVEGLVAEAIEAELTVWETPEPPDGVGFQVLEDHWDMSTTPPTRVIRRIKLEA